MGGPGGDLVSRRGDRRQTVSKQKRDDTTEAAEIVMRHTKLGTEQAMKFVEGCWGFICKCELLGILPDEEIFAVGGVLGRDTQ
jgi:hypothetical protein